MEEPVNVATVAAAEPTALKESTGIQGGKRVWVVRKSGTDQPFWSYCVTCRKSIRTD